MNSLQFLKIIFQFLLTAIFISQINLGQTDSTYLQTEEVLENILQEPIGKIDDSDLYESIEQLLQNPLNLNTASITELQVIPGMDINVAELIVEHRKRYGDFFSVNELNTIQNLDKSRVKNISPFLFVVNPEVFEC